MVDAGQSLVRFNGIPLAVEGGKCLCTGMPGQDPMHRGSSVVRINGKGVMRVGDSTGHGGRITTGTPGLRSD
ncbi:PAAR motif protein [compost metagenome]